MDVKKALELFGYGSLKEISESDIKRRYRKLIKMCHPDSGIKNIGFSVDDVKNGKRVLERVFRVCSVQSAVREIVFIDINTLINIYKDGRASYNNRIISKNDLKTKDIFLDFSYVIKVDDITTDNSNVYVRYNYKDNYSVDIDVEMSPMNKDIDININGINKKISPKGNCVELNFDFGYNINLKCTLYKKNRIED